MASARVASCLAAAAEASVTSAAEAAAALVASTTLAAAAGTFPARPELVAARGPAEPAGPS